MQGRHFDIVETMKSRIIKKVFASIAYILLMLLVATLAILYASGYRFNKNRIYKVSVVHFVADPAAELIINGEDANIKTPKAIYLEPGEYQVELFHSGYQSQLYNVTLGSGEFFEHKDINLFKSNISPTIENQKQVNPNQLVDESLANNSNLFIAFDHEIWTNSHLVTRFYDRLLSVSYYTNQNYIVYQTDKAVGIIDINGSNNTILFKYQTTNPLKISFSNQGQTLQVYDGDKLITATIR